jgi:hypothetical protein
LVNKYSKYPGDIIDAKLEPGEYVLNRNAVKAIGQRKLDKFNNKVAPRFQEGGDVNKAIQEQTALKMRLAGNAKRLILDRQAKRGRIVDAQSLRRSPDFNLDLQKVDFQGNVPEFDAKTFEQQQSKIQNSNHKTMMANNPEYAKLFGMPENVQTKAPEMGFHGQDAQPSYNESNNLPENYADIYGPGGSEYSIGIQGSDPKTWNRPTGTFSETDKLMQLIKDDPRLVNTDINNPKIQQILNNNPLMKGAVEDGANTLDEQYGSVASGYKADDAIRREALQSEMNQKIQDRDDLRETNYNIKMMNPLDNSNQVAKYRANDLIQEKARQESLKDVMAREYSNVTQQQTKANERKAFKKKESSAIAEQVKLRGKQSDDARLARDAEMMEKQKRYLGREYQQETDTYKTDNFGKAFSKSFKKSTGGRKGRKERQDKIRADLKAAKALKPQNETSSVKEVQQSPVKDLIKYPKDHPENDWASRELTNYSKDNSRQELIQNFLKKNKADGNPEATGINDLIQDFMSKDKGVHENETSPLNFSKTVDRIKYPKGHYKALEKAKLEKKKKKEKARLKDLASLGVIDTLGKNYFIEEHQSGGYIKGYQEGGGVSLNNSRRIFNLARKRYV